MDIITAIGIDLTFFMQFGLFLLTYVILTRFVFQPYFKAFEKRDQDEQDVADISQESESVIENLEKEFSKKAQSLREDIKDIYNKETQSAQEEYKQIISKAQEKARLLVADHRKQLQSQATSSKAQIDSEVSSVAEAISKKMLGL